MNVPPYILKVWAVTRCIPEGRVSTYGAIASYIGLGSSRMTGWALKHTAMEPNVPAHRVVNRLGELSGRLNFATPDLMQELLEYEGVPIKDHTVQDFDTLFWNPNIELGATLLEEF